MRTYGEPKTNTHDDSRRTRLAPSLHGLHLRCVFQYLLCIAALLLSGFVTAAQDTRTTDRVTYTVERVTSANYPVALAFTPDGRLFYTEKTTGSVRVISRDGVLQAAPVITLPVNALAERGMLGITADPNYAENGYLWVVHTAPPTAREYAANTLVRFHEAGGVGSDAEIMFSVPLTENTLIHNGGSIRFDDDGYLYLSVGDYENPANSQDLDVPQGKIHRFAVGEGGLTPAPDNPFADSSIYAYGLRNPYDFDFHPETGYLYAGENGDTCDDEINLILPGFNYGAGADYVCGDHAPGIDTTLYLPGLLTFTPTIAPTGVIVYDHDAVPDWYGDVFFCTWNTSALVHLELDDSGTRVLSQTEIDLGETTCRIALEISPDGALYFTSVGAFGGAIYRLLPEPVEG